MSVSCAEMNLATLVIFAFLLSLMPTIVLSSWIKETNGSLGSSMDLKPVISVYDAHAKTA